jgi:hypothetical protein
MNIEDVLRAFVFKEDGVNKVMGGNWLHFFDSSFGPQK